MNLEFDKLNIEERPTIVLETLNFDPIAVMGDAYGLSANIKYNEVSEIEFTVPHFVDGKENTYFDDVTSMRIAHVTGLGRFRLTTPSNTIDGISEVKVCKAYSLECELSYKTLNLAQGTYNLWNPLNYGNTIIGMFLNDFPAWRVNMMRDGEPNVEVPASLYDKYRTFEISDNWYNFLKSTAQQAYQCVFEFDSFNRILSVRAAKDGADHKSVFIAPENLAKEIQVEELSDEIYTCFDVYGASDVDIRTVNPTGTNKIYDLSYYMKDKKNFGMLVQNPDLKGITATIPAPTLIVVSSATDLVTGESVIIPGTTVVTVDNISSGDNIVLDPSYSNPYNIINVEALDGAIKFYINQNVAIVEDEDVPMLLLDTGGETYIPLYQKYQKWCDAIETARESYYSYSMRRANMYVELEAAKVAYTELQGEYTSYENLFSAAAQAESAGYEVKESSAHYRGKIKEVYDKMVLKAQEITAIESRISELQDLLDNISNGLAFEQYFSEEELIILSPYVKESVMNESTFVASNTAVYGQTGAILNGTNHTISITNAPVVDCRNSESNNGILATESSITTYRADGGILKIRYTNEDNLLEINGSVQRAVYDISETEVNGDTVFKLVGSIVFQKETENEDGTTNTVTATLTIVKDNFDMDCLSIQTSYDYEEEPDKDTSYDGYMNIVGLENATVYLTSETTEFQRNSVQWELYDYAWDLLTKSAAPSYSFSASVANFLTLDDFELFRKQLLLGERVYLQLREGYVLEPIVVGITFEYDDPESVSLEFANQFNSNSGEFGILDILEQSVSLGGTVDTSRFTWEEWSNGASTVVENYMTQELNAAKQRIVGASNQAISFDGSGLHLRKYKDDNTQYAENAPDIVRNSEYDPKQAWLTHDGFMFTDDGWESVRMAIGRHSNGNYGVIGDEIVGEIFIGEKLYLSLDSDDSTKYISMNENGMVVSGSAFRVINSNNEEQSIEEIIESAGTTSYKSPTPPVDPKAGDLWFCHAETGETIVSGYEAEKWYRYAIYDYPTHESIIVKYEELLSAIEAANTDVTNGVEGAEDTLTSAQKALSDYDAELKSIFGSAANSLDLVDGTKDEQIAIINTLPSQYGKWDLLEEQVGLDHVSGTVSTEYTLDEMISTSGNLYMGDSGLWLIDTPDPTTATKAVWVNGSGILVGNGRVSSTYEDDPSYKDSKALDWTTAINADGVYATQFVGDYMYGSFDIGVGLDDSSKYHLGEDGHYYNFYVEEDGTVYAKSANIKGDIDCTSLSIDGDDIMDLIKSLQKNVAATDDALELTNTTLEIHFTATYDDDDNTYNVINMNGGLVAINDTQNATAATIGAFETTNGLCGIGIDAESGYPIYLNSGGDMSLNTPTGNGVYIGKDSRYMSLGSSNNIISIVQEQVDGGSAPGIYIGGADADVYINGVLYTGVSSGGTAVYA